MARGERGLPQLVGGAEELIQRALIRLTVRRGSFALDPGLGSELNTLRAAGQKNLDDAAANLVRQALLPLPEVEATRVRCTREGERLLLRVELRVLEQTKILEVEMG